MFQSDYEQIDGETKTFTKKRIFGIVLTAVLFCAAVFGVMSMNENQSTTGVAFSNESTSTNLGTELTELNEEEFSNLSNDALQTDEEDDEDDEDTITGLESNKKEYWKKVNICMWKRYKQYCFKECEKKCDPKKRYCRCRQGCRWRQRRICKKEVNAAKKPAKASTLPLDNIGKPCWGSCLKRGFCGWCGTKGSCCRQSDKVDVSTGCYPGMGGRWSYECAAPPKKEANGLLNKGKNCWRSCGKKDGACPNFCGTGFCCKLRVVKNGCDGSVGDPKKHICVNKQTPAPVGPGGIKNAGKKCWFACRGQGECKSGFCGTGYCCRKFRTGGGCDGRSGTDKDHTCVKKPTPAPSLPEPKEPWKIPCPEYDDIPRAKEEPGLDYKKEVCDMLAIINKARDDWNKAKKSEKFLKPYCMNSKLMRAARIQSHAMAKCQRMKHNLWRHGCKTYLPAWGNQANRIIRCGYKFGGGNAEICAGGRHAINAYNAWYSEYTSSGKTNNHYGAIVNPDRSQVGIAAESLYGTGQGIFWTVVTSRPRKFGYKEKCDMQDWCKTKGAKVPRSDK